MAQQSDTEPREAPKRQGKLTQEQQQRIINKQENTKGADVPSAGETLREANQRYPKPGPGGEYQIYNGDREMQRAANDERDHHKRRADDD
jgi:hypothetical protein